MDTSELWDAEVRKAQQHHFQLFARFSWHWEGIGIPTPWESLMYWLWCSRFGHAIRLASWTSIDFEPSPYNGEDSEFCSRCGKERDILQQPATFHIPAIHHLKGRPNA